jgi:Hint domain
VCIPAHAFGTCVPSDDLFLSPQHRVVVAGENCELLFGRAEVFVAARHLLGSVARPADPGEDVHYHHLLLDRHEILLANDLACESFQPARRTIDPMTGENRAALEAVLATLGEAEMLARPDALPTLTAHEAQVLTHAMMTQAAKSGTVRLDRAGTRQGAFA